MSHLSEYKSTQSQGDGRALGDEWIDWDGKGDEQINEGKRLFLIFSAAVIIIMDVLLCLVVYMITPRLNEWHPLLTNVVWGLVIGFIAITSVWMFLVITMLISGRNLFPMQRTAYLIFNISFTNAFRLASVFGISRDRLGHSFVRVSNSLSRALKPKNREEKLLILLPRCLSKDELKEINLLKDKYPIEVFTVSGGELARRKVKELKPTAVIGVACERDLVSGIRDVGQKISVIGIPNMRPEGPCKNTRIDMNELISSIEFYVGKQRQSPVARDS